MVEDFGEVLGFEWDEGNRGKNSLKHSVEWWEIEEIFFNEPLIAVPDSKHSKDDRRYYTLGETDNGRRLFVVYCVRHGLIRPISARDMSKKERSIYEKAGI